MINESLIFCSAGCNEADQSGGGDDDDDDGHIQGREQLIG